MRILMIGLVVLLAGCTTKEPVVRTVRVEVPVLIPCKTHEVDAPSFAATGLKKADSLEVKVRALLAERKQRIAYEKILLTSNKSCSM